MLDESVGERMHRASVEIADCIGTTVLAMQIPLMKKFDLDGGQLAAAIVASQMNLLAYSVTGVILGGDATKESIDAAANELIEKLRPVVNAAIGSPR